MDKQANKWQEVIDADNKKPPDKYFENLWASHPHGTIMEKVGSGNYRRDQLKSRTGNYDESRHMKKESQRLKYRGEQYMSLGNYEIRRKKEVRMFITCNVMLFYLNFLTLMLILMVIK